MPSFIFFMSKSAENKRVQPTLSIILVRLENIRNNKVQIIYDMNTFNNKISDKMAKWKNYLWFGPSLLQLAYFSI